MNNFMLTTIRWLLSCLIFILAACEQKNTYKTFIPSKQDSLKRIAFIKRAFIEIYKTKKDIQNGDIITRTGNDFTSESLRNLNQRNKTYSHCGIASIEGDSIFVYHALGGEFNPNQLLKREAIEYFAEPYNNKGIGIFRFNMEDSIKRKFAIVARDHFINQIMFDMDFDLKTDDRMYCAEFVYKTLLKASNKKLVFNHSHIKSFEFIGVDDIFLQPFCKLQVQLVYK